MKTVQIELPKDLSRFLHKMHDSHEPVAERQSVRNGTQGHIPLNSGVKPILALIRSLNTAIGGMLGTQAWGYTGLWSTRLPKGGFHVQHNHPKGWMSGICYVDVPSHDGGLLEFENSFLIPSTGDVVLFPSETLHAVTLYRGETPRLTVAFDLLPLVNEARAA